jgi:hypothetical protein
LPAEYWIIPTGEEVRAVLKMANLSGSEASKKLGLKDGRTIRRWVSEDSPIPYACWAILCDLAGLGVIWRKI